MKFVHGSNLEQKENHLNKYRDEVSQTYLAEIRTAYNKWHASNIALIGPKSTPADTDKEVITERVKLFENYKTFIDQQKYAEQFDSRSNLHSSVMEEFLYYLFRDLVADFGDQTLIGKSHSFKDIFFMAPNYQSMLDRPHASIERKDHDFVIGVTVEAQLKTKESEIHTFDIPAVVIECKTYLDKTMLEGSSRAADELKARNPNSLYIVATEWLKLTNAVNLRKYKVDQIYIFRKQKNTDREFRFALNYSKNPVDSNVVYHLFDFVRNHLTFDWEGGMKHGLERGWLV